MTDTRKGKIARLPLELRDQVNRRLSDGEPGPKICAWLNGIDQVKSIMADQFSGEAISVQNLSEWRKGGFQDWQKDQDRVENIRRLAEISMRMANAAEGSIAEGGAAIAAGKLLAALESATEDDLTGMVQSLTSLRMAEIAAMRARTDEKRLTLQTKNFDLEKQKFQRQTAEMFLKWFDDETAKRIAEGKGTKEVKLDSLVKLMWGEAPNAAKA